MNESRKMILQMLKDGEISVDDAERLIEAVSDERPEESEAAPSGPSPKRISVKVTELGKTKVNVKIPFSLLRIALKLGKTAGLAAAITTKNVDGETATEILDALKEIDPDEILGSLSDGDISLPYTIVDVDDDDADQHVKIILE